MLVSKPKRQEHEQHQRVTSTHQLFGGLRVAEFRFGFYQDADPANNMYLYRLPGGIECRHKIIARTDTLSAFVQSCQTACTRSSCHSNRQVRLTSSATVSFETAAVVTPCSRELGKQMAYRRLLRVLAARCDHAGSYLPRCCCRRVWVAQ